MSDTVEPQSDDTIERSRGATILLAAGFGLIAAAALMLWARFGPEIFNDALAALQGCF